MDDEEPVRLTWQDAKLSRYTVEFAVNGVELLKSMR
jgi:hypothetical protein